MGTLNPRGWPLEDELVDVPRPAAEWAIDILTALIRQHLRGLIAERAAHLQAAPEVPAGHEDAVSPVQLGIVPVDAAE